MPFVSTTPERRVSAGNHGLNLFAQVGQQRRINVHLPLAIVDLLHSYGLPISFFLHFFFEFALRNYSAVVRQTFSAKRFNCTFF